MAKTKKASKRGGLDGWTPGQSQTTFGDERVRLMGATEDAEPGRPPESGAVRPPPPPSQARRRRQRIASATLFQGDRELVIIHEGEEYLLRITRNGKLILTK